MQDILSLPPVSADHRIPYGRDANQFIDLFLPRTKANHPVLMNIHGGYWRAKYDLKHASRFCRALADSGIAVLSAEYRRVGNTGGGWPGTFNDVLAAWQHLRALAPKYKLDLDSAGVLGHSAGGQLAIALACRAQDLSPKPKAAVSLAGVLDLNRAFELHLSQDAVVAFLAGTPDRVPKRYAEADPMQLRVRVPQVLFHGVPDQDVPVELSRNYTKAKRAAHENIAYNESRTAVHFEWIDPRTPEFAQIRSALAKAL
ncbi:MAG TPA: alpha/beta hydrolase [Terriglobales bacterium]